METNEYLNIKGGQVITDGVNRTADLLIHKGRIERIDSQIAHPTAREINATGKIVMPGIIDDQVHFREPGLTHKANIRSESRAAVAGGVTSFMEMPNTKPSALTQELLQDKYDIAAGCSPSNYSFFMGASNDNLEEVLKTDHQTVCGVKIFMGSSTGNMLVDNEETLNGLFSQVDMLMATHCEDEQTIRNRKTIYRERYGENVPMSCHPEIRNEEACYLSSSLAVNLAKKHDARLHILHLTTAEELDLFTNSIPLTEKRVTSEVCVHHLYFTADDYAQLGSKVKCNPAIKDARHKPELWKALLDDRLDIIATDHAPHTLEEKSNSYFRAPSGLPLVQHALTIMLDCHQKGMISLERMVEKMCHAPATCFQLKDRGFLREGYWADIAIVDPDHQWTIEKENILYHCGWSPLEGKTFQGKVVRTLVNGQTAWDGSQVIDNVRGQRLIFDRE